MNSGWITQSVGTGKGAIGDIPTPAIVSPGPLTAAMYNVANSMDCQSNRSAEERRISSSTDFFMPDVDPGMFGFEGMPQTVRVPDELLDGMLAGNVSVDGILNQGEITGLKC